MKFKILGINYAPGNHKLTLQQYKTTQKILTYPTVFGFSVLYVVMEILLEKNNLRTQMVDM